MKQHKERHSAYLSNWGLNTFVIAGLIWTFLTFWTKDSRHIIRELFGGAPPKS